MRGVSRFCQSYCVGRLANLGQITTWRDCGSECLFSRSVDCNDMYIRIRIQGQATVVYREQYRNTSLQVRTTPRMHIASLLRMIMTQWNALITIKQLRIVPFCQIHLLFEQDWPVLLVPFWGSSCLFDLKSHRHTLLLTRCRLQTPLATTVR